LQPRLPRSARATVQARGAARGESGPRAEEGHG
jgi:hypothetical protein